MPYVKPLGKHEAPPEAKPVLDAIEEKCGKVLNIFGTMRNVKESGCN